jgi:2-polyprenyl-3-methyl-5-hydroxy-6-metoxy-1,4-benzoquinol methylase
LPLFQIESGFFLKIARERGWKVKGIDPSIKSVKIARRNNCPYVYKGTLEEYTKSGLFDVITFINALDHSAQPWTEIEKSKKLLKPGGFIFLRFSNGLLHSAIYNLFQTFSLTKKVQKLVVFHEYSFTPKFIKKLLGESGLSNIMILNSPSTLSAIGFIHTEKTLKSILNCIYSFLAIAIKYITFNRIYLGSSLLVIARKA